MEIFEQALREFLIGTNLVGSRVWLMQAPQRPAPQTGLPYIVFFHVAPLPHHTQLGPIGLLERDYQFSIIDGINGQNRALAIGDSLREAFDGFRGDVKPPWTIDAVFYQSQTWLRDEQPQFFHVVQVYRIQFHSLTPLKQPAVPTVVTTERSM